MLRPLCPIHSISSQKHTACSSLYFLVVWAFASTLLIASQSYRHRRPQFPHIHCISSARSQTANKIRGESERRVTEQFSIPQHLPLLLISVHSIIDKGKGKRLLLPTASSRLCPIKSFCVVVTAQKESKEERRKSVSCAPTNHFSRKGSALRQ